MEGLNKSSLEKNKSCDGFSLAAIGQGGISLLSL